MRSPASTASWNASPDRPSTRAANASSAASRAKSDAGQAAASARQRRAPDGQPGAGQPESENLIGVHLEPFYRIRQGGASAKASLSVALSGRLACRPTGQAGGVALPVPARGARPASRRAVRGSRALLSRRSPAGGGWWRRARARQRARRPRGASASRRGRPSRCPSAARAPRRRVRPRARRGRTAALGSRLPTRRRTLAAWTAASPASAGSATASPRRTAALIRRLRAPLAPDAIRRRPDASEWG